MQEDLGHGRGRAQPLSPQNPGFPPPPLPGTGSVPKDVEVVVAPPHVFLDQVQAALKPPFQVSAQNCWRGKGGAFTGEVTADMLADKGVGWVILGHSERRALMGETDDVVGHKVAYALSKGLSVIPCVGETLEERESGALYDVLGAQLS